MLGKSQHDWGLFGGYCLINVLVQMLLFKWLRAQKKFKFTCENFHDPLRRIHVNRPYTGTKAFTTEKYDYEISQLIQ